MTALQTAFTEAMGTSATYAGVLAAAAVPILVIIAVFALGKKVFFKGH